MKKMPNNSVNMNPFTLSFKGETENRFANFYVSHYIGNMRVSMLLGILVWSLFGLLEIWFYPKEILWPLLKLRYLYVLPLMLCSVSLTFVKNPKKYVSIAISMGIMACGFGIISKFAILPKAITFSPIPSLVTIFLYGYAVMRARFIWASLTGFMIIVFYEIINIWVRPLAIQQLVTSSFFLIMANFIGMYVCYWLELFTRKNFLYSESLKKHQKNLENLVQNRTKELENTQHEIIHMLGSAAEYRDCETGQHIKRISYYSLSLAKAINLNKKECRLLFYASQMHDVGKIGIPDSILLKPGKLDDEEWRVMKKHTTIGSEILTEDHSPLLEMAKLIALLHHEKWDGSGYPKGLKKQNIPMLARIVCLCDVFDSLTSNRPYKHAWSPNDALKEIESLSGSFFDPLLVQKFKEIFPEILRIRNHFLDKPKTSYINGSQKSN